MYLYMHYILSKYICIFVLCIYEYLYVSMLVFTHLCLYLCICVCTCFNVCMKLFVNCLFCRYLGCYLWWVWHCYLGSILAFSFGFQC